MIEIEKKFKLNPGDEERLLRGAQFAKEVVNDDTYWDTSDFVLTRKDWWLRLRNGAWELKIALHKPGSGVDQYRELETEDEIAEAIGLATYRRGPLTPHRFEEDLRAAGYVPAIPIVTTRRKYQDGEFHIDIDSADFGYVIVEIEVMVEDEADMDAAAERIMRFAESRGLSTGNIRGKVLEYLIRFRPDHYRALVESGVARA